VQAARLLGLKRSTLRYRMVRAGLGSPRGGAALALRVARRSAMLPQQESSRNSALGGDTLEPSAGWEQKLVAVLAIDLSFPMAIGLEALPYEPRTVAKRWEQAIAEKVQGFGGVLLQRTAPPLMAVFGLPQTLDQLPQRAVQTALAIRQLVAEAEAAARHEPVPAVRQALHLGMLLIEGQAHERAVSLAYALNVATWLHQLRREAVLIQERSEALLALCDEQGFALYRTVGSILRGWALAEQGQVVEGVAQMYESLTTRRTVGAKGTDTCYLAMLAQGYWHSGQPEAGLTVLAEALAAVDQSGVRFYEAELYRLKGELLLAQAGKGHKGQEAEACFRQALAVARRQQAKWLELRAAISLSRLWQHQGKRAEARCLLAEIYGWFTEGFETSDLQDAKALLDELA